VAAGGQLLAVGGVDDAADAAAVGADQHFLAHGGPVPEADQAVAAPAGHGLAVGTDGDSGAGRALPPAMLAQDGDQRFRLPVEPLEGGDSGGVELVEGGLCLRGQGSGREKEGDGRAERSAEHAAPGGWEGWLRCRRLYPARRRSARKWDTEKLLVPT